MADRRGVARLFGLRLHLLHKQAVEIDRVEQQRLETAVAHDVGNDAACEGEQDARRFGKEEGLQLICLLYTSRCV